MTQADLAERTGKKTTEISAIENGDSRRVNMKIETVSTFARAFDLHAGDLIAMLDSIDRPMEPSTKVPA